MKFCFTTVQHLVHELYKSLLEDDENFAGFDLKFCFTIEHAFHCVVYVHQ